MSQSAVNRLLEALRGSGFSRGVVRVDGLHLEFGQASAARPAAGPQPRPDTTPTETTQAETTQAETTQAETEVRAGGPGVVELAVAPGEVVEQGAELGRVRVHRTTVPLVAPVRGRVTALRLPDGGFAAYGDVVCAIRAD